MEEKDNITMASKKEHGACVRFTGVEAYNGFDILLRNIESGFDFYNKIRYNKAQKEVKGKRKEDVLISDWSESGIERIYTKEEELGHIFDYIRDRNFWFPYFAYISQKKGSTNRITEYQLETFFENEAQEEVKRKRKRKEDILISDWSESGIEKIYTKEEKGKVMNLFYNDKSKESKKAVETKNTDSFMRYRVGERFDKIKDYFSELVEKARNLGDKQLLEHVQSAESMFECLCLGQDYYQVRYPMKIDEDNKHITSSCTLDITDNLENIDLLEDIGMGSDNIIFQRNRANTMFINNVGIEDSQQMDYKEDLYTVRVKSKIKLYEFDDMDNNLINITNDSSSKSSHPQSIENDNVKSSKQSVRYYNYNMLNYMNGRMENVQKKNKQKMQCIIL